MGVKLHHSLKGKEIHEDVREQSAKEEESNRKLENIVYRQFHQILLG
jgi:hypothetical protein